MNRFLRSTLLLASLQAASLEATELRTSVVTATTYNSNIYGYSSGETDDVIVQLGPEVELRSDREGRFDYRLNYRGYYQWYTRESDADDFQHRERLRLGYDFSPRTRLDLDQQYRRVSNLQFDRDDFRDGDAGIDIRQNRYHRNDLNLGLTHALTARWRVNGSIEHQLVDFDRNFDRSDSDTLGVGLSLSYTLSERHDLGLGVRYAVQDFDEASSRLGAESDYFNVNLLWTFRISERMTLSFEGGPTRIDTEQDALDVASADAFVGTRINEDLFRANYGACSTGQGQTQPIASLCRYDSETFPPIPADDLGAELGFPLDFAGVDLDDDSVEFFGRLALTAGFSDWEIEAAYTRRPSAISGESLASLLDALTLSFDYRPAAYRWATYGELRWDRRDALTRAVEIDYTLLPGSGSAALRDDAILTETGGGSDRNTFAVLLGLSYGFTERFSTRIEGRYRDSDQQDSGGSAETWILELGLRYDLAPERF